MSLVQMVPTSKAANTQQIADATEMEAVVDGTAEEEEEEEEVVAAVVVVVVAATAGEEGVAWVAVFCMFSVCFLFSKLFGHLHHRDM